VAPTINSRNLTGITVKGGSGSDVFTISNTDATLPVTVNVGSGAAAVNINSLGGPLTSVLGAVTITGSTGSTHLSIDDQNDPSSAGTITVSTGTSTGSVTGMIPAPVSYDASAHVTDVRLLPSKGGANTINVVATGVPTVFNSARTTNATKASTFN